MSGKTPIFLIILVTGLALAGGGFFLTNGSGQYTTEGQSASMADNPSSVPSQPSGPNQAFDVSQALNTAFVGLAESVMPSVVRIEVRRAGRVPTQSIPQLELPEPFPRFFEMPDFQNPQREPIPQLGGGTGFIVSSGGHIVTNNHVVGDADEITVWLSDQRSYEATLIGRDPTTDVAVIQIEGNDLPPLRWGSSDDLSVGEWVLAIGNPGFGGTGPLDYTVTTGIVSAKDRPLQLIGRSLARDPEFGEALAGYAIENFIQTDAVINPGNSGGPLVDLEGRVVGINTAIASTTGYYQGYGFAVPADLAQRVVDDLIEDGRVQRAWLGVSVTAVAAEDADVYGLPGVYGALVQEVTEGGPADRAGIRPEDVIVAVDGEPVYRGGGLQQLVAERRPEQKVAISVYRNRNPLEMDVQLGELPIEELEEGSDAARSGPAAVDRLGMEVQNLTVDLARNLGYEDSSGVVVSGLEPLGPAARRGVARGLKILEVDGMKIQNTRDVDRALSGVGRGTVVSLLLQSPDGRTKVANIRTR